MKQIGRYTKRIDGGSIYEYEVSNRKLVKLEIPDNNLVIRPECIYVEALNYKNAWKKLANRDYFAIGRKKPDIVNDSLEIKKGWFGSLLEKANHLFKLYSSKIFIILL